MSSAANSDSSKLQYHIACRTGDVGRYVLLPGDPKRVPLIAKFFDTAQEIAQHREYTTYTGTLDGVTVSVTSTGIGGPSTAIAVEELAKIGADTFIRVGTSRPMQPYVETGDLVVVTGAVRDEGTALHYMPLGFPAIADLDVVDCLRAACAARNVRYHIGLCHSNDSHYGAMQPERMPVADQLAERWRALVRGGVLCSEMEAAALFVIANTLGKRAGGLLLALDQSRPVEELCATAVEGLRQLISRDAEQARRMSSAATDHT
jgi:uridine phosphorylase